MSSPSQHADGSAKARPFVVIAGISALGLVTTLLLSPVLGPVETLSSDVRFALRYDLRMRVLPTLRKWLRVEDSSPAALKAGVSGDVSLIGIDGETQRNLGKFGNGRWVVREPFMETRYALQRDFPPSVIAYDILFRPTTGEGRSGRPEDLAPEAIDAIIGSLEQFKRDETVQVENDVLLDMTRFASDQGEVNLASAFADVMDPVEVEGAQPIPVVCAYDFTGLEDDVSSQTEELPAGEQPKSWSRTDILGEDPDDESLENGTVLPYLLDVRIAGEQVHDVPADYRYLTYAYLPSPVMRDSVVHGFINVPRDADGIIRSAPLVLGFEYTNPLTGESRNVFVPSFSLLTVLYHWGLVALDWTEEVQRQGRIRPGAIEVFFGSHLLVRRRDGSTVRIPIDHRGRMFLNFQGRIGDFHNLPLWMLMPAADPASADAAFEPPGAVPGAEDTVAATPETVVRDGRGSTDRALRGKIAMVGLTATGTTDIGPCPIDTQTPYVHIHMTAASNILSGQFIRPMGAAGLAGILVCLAVGLTAIALRMHVRSLTWAIGALLVGYLVLSYLLVHADVSVIPIVSPVLYLSITYAAVVLYRYYTEERARKQVRRMFSTMVSPDVLNFMEENPESFSLSGHRVEATIMFSDVAGFTSISERLTPEQLTELLNEYLSAMTDIILERNGYVDKYEGDAIMAEWGVPYPDPMHGEAACLSCIEQQETLARIRPSLAERFGVDLRVRMGVNSGPVIAGNMGSSRRFQYTVMGDTVNQAARFEPTNKVYDTNMMVGESTYQLASAVVEVRLLDKVVVMGKTEPVCVYELLGRKGGVAAAVMEVKELYEEALRKQWERQWDDSEKLLGQALAICPDDGASRVILERVGEYRTKPPADGWQGEYVRTSKD